MSEANSHEITQLLLAWGAGDKAALDQLMPLVYAELRRVAQQHMRQVLVDLARERGSQKRGGAARQISLDEALVVSRQRDEGVLALDEALSALAQLDPRKSQMVELRFFGVLSVKETAEALNVSVETVHRDWRSSKSWLLRRLRGEGSNKAMR